MLPHKNTPLRLQEVTVSPEFRSEKVKPKKKKKKKAEELLSTETARKILLKKKKKNSEVSNYQRKNSKH